MSRKLIVFSPITGYISLYKGYVQIKNFTYNTIQNVKRYPYPLFLQLIFFSSSIQYCIPIERADFNYLKLRCASQTLPHKQTFNGDFTILNKPRRHLKLTRYSK